MMLVDWIDLAPSWPRLEELSLARNTQKGMFESTRIFGGVNTHFLGLCGEKLVSIRTGWPLNEELLINGDGGLDYPFTNVKATQYWHDPWLKEFENPKKKLAFYILTAVDLEGKRGWIPGFTTARRLFAAPLVDWGHGERHSIRHDDPAMYPMGQYRLAVSWHRELGAVSPDAAALQRAMEGARLW